MPVSRKQQACVERYKSAHYDRISYMVPKGQKAVIQAHAAAADQSVNAYITQAVEERMQREAEPPESR